MTFTIWSYLGTHHFPKFPQGMVQSFSSDIIVAQATSVDEIFLGELNSVFMRTFPFIWSRQFVIAAGHVIENHQLRD